MAELTSHSGVASPATGSPAGPAVPRRVWGAALQLGLGRLFAAGTGAAVLVLLARALPAAQFGRFTFYAALFLVVESLADFGSGTAALQRGAHDPRRLAAAIATARRARTVTCSLAAGALLAAGLAFDAGALGWIALASALCFTRVLETSGLVLQSEIAWGRPVATRSAGAALRLGLCVALVAAGVGDAAPYVVAHVAGASFGHVLLHAASRARLRALAPGPVGPLPLAPFLASAAALGVAGLCQQAYVYVDNLFVRALAGDAELALYNAGARLCSFLVLFAVHATTAALPWLVRAQGRGELAGALERLALPVATVGCLATGAALPFAGEITAALFGPAYADAGASLRWLLGAAALVFAGAPLLTGVVALGAARAPLVQIGRAHV